MVNKFARLMILLSLMTTMIYAQGSATDGGRLLNFNPQKLHPDGLIGKLSVSAEYRYSSVTKAPGAPLADIQKLTIGLSSPISNRFSLAFRAKAISEDSVHYLFDLSSRLYLKSPQSTESDKNADGAIGWPVLVFAYQKYYSGANDDNYQNGFRAGLIMPINVSVTSAFEYISFKDKYDETISDYSFTLKLYTSKYKENLPYLNPDGPIGAPVFSLLVGHNQNRDRGEFGFMMPFDQSLTLAALLSFEKIEFDEQKNYTAGLGLSYHFKN